jgi:hypothetical protein
MAFTKGKSGNPGGRPRGLQKLVREMLGRRGWAAVVETQFKIATGAFASDSKLGLQAREVTAAATWLADRGFGKPIQQTDVTSNGQTVGGPVVVLDTETMSEDQLADIEARLEEAGAADAAGGEVDDDELGGDGTMSDPEESALLAVEAAGGLTRGPSN